MKIVGQATITKKERNADGTFGKRTEIGTFKNTITRRLMENFINDENSKPEETCFSDLLRIATSLEGGTPSYQDITLNQIHAVGDPALVGSPYLFTDRVTGVSPAELLYTARFLPPASDRTINRLGLVSGAVLIDDPSATTSRNAWTQLGLGVSFIQLSIEILDISYKVFIDWSGSAFGGVPEGWQRKVEMRLFMQRGTSTNLGGNFSNLGFLDADHYNAHITWFTDPATSDTQLSMWPYAGFDFSAFRRFRRTVNAIGVSDDPPPFSTENPGYFDFQYGRRRIVFGNIAGDNVLNLNCQGSIIRGFLWGNPRTQYDPQYLPFQSSTNHTDWEPEFFNATDGYNDWFGYYPYTKTTNLSNVWSHNADGTNTPMYNVNALANSSWKPIITETTNIDDFPTIYYLKVSSAGGLGTGGEYKLYRDNFGGYPGNAYSRPLWDALWVASSDGFIHDDKQEHVLFEDNWVYNWTDGTDSFKFVSGTRRGGIALWELKSQSCRQTDKFGISSYAQFQNYIFDLAVDPGNDKIYAATEGGLYEIVVTGAVVTQLSGDRCVAVDVGFSGAVVAVFADGVGGGRLSSSFGATWATALDVTGSSITWENVLAVKIDPDSSDYELMIYQGPVAFNTFQEYTATLPYSNFIRIHWWDNVSNWISTDSYSAEAGPEGNTTRDTIWFRNFLLPHNDSISVRNGLWIYPTKPYPAGAVTEAGAEANRFDNCLRYVGITMDIGHELAAQNRRLRWSGSTSPAWNGDRGDLTGYDEYPLGMSAEWAFGLHATTPFHTEDFDGNISCVWRHKPSPGATVYDLHFIVSHHNYIASNDPVDAGQRRVPMIFRLSVDEAGTSTLKDYITAESTRYRLSRRDSQYYAYGHTCTYRQSLDGSRVFWFSSPRSGGNIYQNITQFEPTLQNGGNILRKQEHWDGGIGCFNLVVRPETDLAERWPVAYEWTGAAWIIDTDNTGPGRPLHTSTETLIDGLSIRWEDLLPGNSQDLVLDQFYNFAKITGDQGVLCETTAPNVSGEYVCYYREIVTGNVGGTVPVGLTLTVDEAPTGAVPDVLWLAMPPDNIGPEFNATINGTPVPVTINAGTPPPGEIYLTSNTAGTFAFNAADSGQPLNLNYWYLKKYDVTET